MAFAVAVLGVKTAVEKQGLLPGTPQVLLNGLLLLGFSPILAIKF